MFKKYRVLFSILLSICILLSYILPTYAIATEVILGGEALLGILMITMMGARGIRMSSSGMSSESVGDQIEDYIHNWVLRKEVNALALRAVAKGAWIQVSDTLSDILAELISDFTTDKGLSVSTVGSTSSIYSISGSYVVDTLGNTYTVYTGSVHSDGRYYYDDAGSLISSRFKYDASLGDPLPYSVTALFPLRDQSYPIAITYSVYSSTRRQATVYVNDTRADNYGSVSNRTDLNLCSFFITLADELYMQTVISDSMEFKLPTSTTIPAHPISYYVGGNVDIISDQQSLTATVDRPYTYPLTTGDDLIYVNPGLGVISTETSLTDVTQRVIDGDLTSTVDIATDFPVTSEVDTIEGDISAVTDLLPFLPNELEILEIPNALYNAVSDTGTNCDLVLKAGNVSIAGHNYHFWDEQTIPLTNTINQDIFLPILWAVRFLFGIALFKTIIYWVNRIVGVCMMEDNAIQSIEGRKERSNDS